jgi:hypothetical protein
LYTETWLYRNGPFEFGFTCCQATRLDNELSQLDERIDLIWARQSADYIGPPFLVDVRANVFGAFRAACGRRIMRVWPQG